MLVKESILNRIIYKNATELLINIEEAFEKHIALIPENIIEVVTLYKTLPRCTGDFLEMDIDKLLKDMRELGIRVDYKILRDYIFVV